MDCPPFPEGVLAAARDAAKAHLRVAGDSEDALIERLAASALALAEAFTGTALVARERLAVLPVSRQWRVLPMAPVTAITAVEGLRGDGMTSVLAAEAWAIDIDAQGEGWVRVTAPGEATRVRVAYGAGAAAGWGELPPPIAQGVLLLVAHLFEAGDGAREPPAAVAALWRPWRRMRLGVERAA